MIALTNIDPLVLGLLAFCAGLGTIIIVCEAVMKSVQASDNE
ncbi:hypothetical protein VB796_06725 [Arcicella sp. LKC2W]|nr:hypothetical protein [Arcicella sp. LKC2W]MEA5458722.1 hypothetical protein [Arcicella sp. LKC2W]